MAHHYLSNGIRGRFVSKYNLSILGPPGAGKGFYGRRLAQAWQMPLYSVSDILREVSTSQSSLLQRADLARDVESGKLLDCNIVSETLAHYLGNQKDQRRDEATPKQDADELLSDTSGTVTQDLLNRTRTPDNNSAVTHNQQQQHPSHNSLFLLDGFPRTLQQIHMMQETWRPDLQVNAVLYLDIPDVVCLEKALGRRYCTKCHSYPNIAHVVHGKFDLPPQARCDYQCETEGSSLNNNNESECQSYWTQRPDDVLEIVQNRLQVHRDHEQPIVDHFEKRGRLFRLRPYRGELDVDEIRTKAEDWIDSLI